MDSIICLTCLGKPCRIYNLTDIVLENLNIRDLLHQLVPLILEEYTISLPDVICGKCMEELVISYKFQKKCLDSLQNLRLRWTEENSLIQGDKLDFTDEAGIAENDDENSISSQLAFGTISIDPLMDNNDESILFNCNDQGNHSGKSENNIEENENSFAIGEYQIGEKYTTATNQCNICKRQFEKAQGLACHMSKIHLKKHLYQCKKCGRRFGAEDPFIRHCNLHLGIKPYPCSKCKKSYGKIGQLNKHMLSHSKNDEEDISYTCKICKKKFDTFDLFKQHGHDDDDKLFQCVKCDKTFESFSDYTKHFKTHRSDNVPQYEIKEKSFHVPEESGIEKDTSEFGKMPIENIAAQLKLEEKKEADNGEDFLENEKEFDEKHKVQGIGSDNKGQITISAEQTESSQCDICQQTFKNAQGLAVHRSITHFKNFLYQCDQCDRGFNVEEFYIKHRNEHLGIKLFKCNQCDKAFPTNGTLNQHLISHSEATPHLCTICGKGFSRTGTLTTHMRRHGNERPFKCSICPKAFKCLSDKIRHMRYHSGKRYECNVCGTSVTTSESLAQHKMIHSGEKPRKCRYCDKSFIALANLKKHERIHTGEKPYKCDYCAKAFCQSSDRKKHMKRMHRDELGNTTEKVQCLDYLQNLRTRCKDENSLDQGDITDNDITEHNDEDLIDSRPKVDSQLAFDTVSMDPLMGNNDENILFPNNDPDNLSGKSETQLKDNENSSSILNAIKESQIGEKSVTTTNQKHVKNCLYQCRKCDKDFNAEDPSMKHCNHRLDTKPHPCSKCEKSFEYIGQLNKHMIKHSKSDKEDISYTCKICKKKFDTFDLFKQHGHDEDENSFKCVICDKTFESFADLETHFKTHKSENVLQHDIEEKSNHVTDGSDIKNDTSEFDKIPNNKTAVLKLPIETIAGQLKSEEEEESDDDEEVLLKDEKEFEEKRKVQEIGSDSKEQRKMSVKQTESRQCNICHQTFKNSQGLSIHRTITHFKSFLYQCDQCDKGFNVEKRYIKHRNKHLGIKLFKCKQCGKAFQTNALLTQHLIAHSEATPHLCTICGKSFSRFGSLKTHIRRHGDERPFKCTLCSKAFKCPSDKIKHMSNQHKGKRYECKICGTLVTTSESLSQHNMIHTGEKPWKCRFCDKRFIVSSNLKNHERIHTGEKPYKCDYCWKTFRQSSDRKKHIRRMHKDELANKNSEKSLKEI